MSTIFLDIETIPGPGHEKISPRREKMNVYGDHGREERAEAESEYFTRVSCNGVTAQIICISYALDDSDPVAIVGEEAQILNSIWPLLKGARLYVGHNVLDFDLKLIIQRSIIHKIPPMTLIPFIRYRSAPVFDTMHEWAKWHGRVRLSELALAFGLPSPKEEMNGAEVYPAYLRGEIEKIALYCNGDVRTTREVYKRMTIERVLGV